MILTPCYGTRWRERSKWKEGWWKLGNWFIIRGLLLLYIIFFLWFPKTSDLIFVVNRIGILFISSRNTSEVSTQKYNHSSLKKCFRIRLKSRMICSRAHFEYCNQVSGRHLACLGSICGCLCCIYSRVITSLICMEPKVSWLNIAWLSWLPNT